MFRIFRPLPWLAALCLAGAGCARTAEEHHPAGPPKYKVATHEEGESAERTFDGSKPEDRQAVSDLMAQGKIEQMQIEKEPDLLGLKWDLGLWTLVVFGMLCLILSKVAWKPMLEGLQKREQSILGAIEDARRARLEADQLRQQFQADMAKAQEKVSAMIEEGRRNAQRVAEEETAKARAVMQEERERMHRELQIAKDQALQELWSRTAQLATLVSSKAIRKQLSPDDHRRLVDEALAELNQRGEEWKQHQVAGV